MNDRTAMTEPLTIGQQLVARWEGPASGWSEPADLAEAIDVAIAAERTACMKIAAHFGGRDAKEIAELIGQRSFNK